MFAAALLAGILDRSLGFGTTIGSLSLGFAKEVALIDQHGDPLLYLERWAYLVARRL